MLDRLIEIGTQAVACLEDNLKQWTDIFGTTLYDAWADPDRATQRIVSQTRDALNERFRRSGECSLFIRVPISDRLVLIWSTVPELSPQGNPEPSYFVDFHKNYDRGLKVAYYDLCDRLCLCRADETPRKERGLTGWVAVAGHPVLLNHENDKVALDRFSLDHPETVEKCRLYGEPVWAQRISEFHPEQDAGNRRFVAVPIRSSVDSDTTIGVIRYTCADRDPEITGLDQGFLEGMARIVSALENLKRVKTRSDRVLLAEAKARQFESDGDFSSYLAFIAEYTMSEIASLYIRLGHEPEARLRLVDAFGLSKPVRKLRLRNRLYDYTQARSGLTWELQSRDFVSYRSAAEVPGWSGLNTSVFYEEAFRRVGLSNFASLPCTEQRQLVGDYGIRLLGGRLRVQDGSGSELCGVLKVEFPRVFDANRLYDRDDKEFLKACSDVLALELRRYRQFYGGSWFLNAGPEKATEFLRLLNGVARTNLFKGLDNQWRKLAANYLNDHKSAIEAAVHGNEFRLPKPESVWKSKVLDVLKSTGKTAGAELINEVMKALVHIATRSYP